MEPPNNAIGLPKCTQPYLSLGVQASSPITWSDCGHYLAFVASDHSVVILHVASNLPPFRYPSAAGKDSHVEPRLNDKSANWNTSVHGVLHGHEGPVRSLLFSPQLVGSSGSVLFSAGSDGVRAWNTVSADCVMYLPIASDLGAAVAAAIVPLAAAGGQGDDSAAAAATAAADEKDRKIKLHEHDVECMEWIVPGKLLATGSKDSSIKLWDVARLACGHAVQAGGSPDPLRASGRLFGGQGGLPRANGAVLVETIDAHKAGITCVASHPSLAQFASTARDGSVKVWNCKHLHARFETKQSYFTQPQQSGRMESTEEQESKSGAADSDRDRREQRCEVLCSLEGHRGDVMTVSWTPDGTKLLSGGRDNAILVWDVQREALLGELRELSAGLAGGHRGDVRGVVPFVGRYMLHPEQLLQQMANGEAGGVAATDEGSFGEDLHAVSISGDGSLVLWRLPEETFKPVQQSQAAGRDAARLAEEEEVQRILADILSGTDLDPNAKTHSSEQRDAESQARTAGESEYMPLPGVQVLQRMLPPCDAAFSALTASGLLRNDATLALSADDSGMQSGANALVGGGKSSAGAASSDPDANYGLSALAVARTGHAAAITTSGGTLFVMSLLPPEPAVLPCLEAAAPSQRWAYAMAQQLWVARATCHRDAITGVQLLHEAPTEGHDTAGSALLLSASGDGCVAVTDTGSNTVVCDCSVGTRITAMAMTVQALLGVPALFPKLPPQAPLHMVLAGTADYSVRLLVLGSSSAVEADARGDSKLDVGSIPASGQFLEVGALLGHEGQVTAVQVSACGRLAVTASADLTVRVWDLRPLLRILQGESAEGVSKSTGKLSLAAGAGALPAMLLSSKHCLRPHTGSVQALSLLTLRQGGLKLATAGDDHKVKLWDLSVPDAPGSSLPAPRLAWLSGSSASLHMASPAAPELGAVSALPHNGSVQAAELAPEGSPLYGLLFTGGWDKLVGVWVTDRLSPATQAIAAVNGRAALGQASLEMPLMMLSGHAGRVTAVQVSRVDAQFLSGDSDGTVIVWALSREQQFTPLRRYHTSPSASLASVFGISRILLPSSSADFFFTGSRGGALQAWPMRAPHADELGGAAPGAADTSNTSDGAGAAGDQDYSSANRDALLTMARRASASAPGTSAGRRRQSSRSKAKASGLRMMGPLRAGSLRSLELTQMETAAATVGKGVLPSVSGVPAGTRTSVLHGSTGDSHAPVLGSAGRTPSSFNFAVQDRAKASLQRDSESYSSGSPKRRPSVARGGKGGVSSTVVNNPLLNRAMSSQRGMAATVSQPAPNSRPVASPQQGAEELKRSADRRSVASSQQGAEDLKRAAQREGSTLPGAMQVQESPLHSMGSTPKGGSSVPQADLLPELPSGAAGGSAGGSPSEPAQPRSDEGTAETAASAQGFQPTQSRKEQVHDSSQALAGEEVAAAMANAGV